MSIFKRLFGSQGEDRGEEPTSMPRDGGPSILECVRTQITEGKPGLSEAGYTLPDEERISQGSTIRWAAGAMDGVLTHHMGSSDPSEAVGKIVKLVIAYSQQPTAKNKAGIYQHVLAEHIVSIIDAVIEGLVEEKKINHQRLYDLAYSFVTESSDREAVKFGLALLGLFRNPANEEIFQLLGRHDEFTLFCAAAIANVTENNEESLWRLGRNATGWGRIQVVERLAHSTANPAIKDWLLREGFRNSVMNEYLAGTCARSGGLLTALSEDRIDRELLTGAGEIIMALIAGGPSTSMDDYEDAHEVTENYLRHASFSAEMVEDFLHVHAIKGYLEDDELTWKERFNSGWTLESRDRLRSQCDAIISRPEWREKVQNQLENADESQFAIADQAARLLGIETWEIHWRRLQDKPADSTRWFHVMTLCQEGEIEKVVEFAKTSIDLAAISTGAALEHGMGRRFQQHMCLDHVLQELRRFPGRGMALIEAGLKSPVIRNRNMAVVALASWPKEKWPEGMEDTLLRAIGCEPDGGLRERMQKTLRGEALFP